VQQPVHVWKNWQALVGMVSDFAVAQCGQVMTDSRIIILPQAAGRISVRHPWRRRLR
jgi:hypothetical protein